MKRPSWGRYPKRGYSLQDIEQSLHAIYSAHEARQATPNHPVNAKNRLEKGLPEEESRAKELGGISSRLNAIAKSEKPTVRDVLQARGGVPMSQAEFKKRLG